MSSLKSLFSRDTIIIYNSSFPPVNRILKRYSGKGPKVRLQLAGELASHSLLLFYTSTRVCIHFYYLKTIFPFARPRTDLLPCRCSAVPLTMPLLFPDTIN